MEFLKKNPVTSSVKFTILFYFALKVSREGERTPLVVAGGGGGLAHKSSHSNNHHKDSIQHGHGMNKTLLPTSGDQHGTQSAG